jgi:hypothetical protein
MDFEWIKGVNYLSKQTWEGWLSLWWFWTKNFEHTNREREELLACWRRALGVTFIGEADRPGWPRASPGSAFLQRDDLPFLTFVPACCTSCIAQTLSSTPLLALLVLPLDAFALSHVHAPLLHMPPWISCKAMLVSHPCLSFACGLDESCWKGIQWSINVHAWFV